MDSTNQKRLPADARASRDVFQAPLPRQGMVKLCKGQVVTRHTGDKPWITDGYRLLIRKRQRAHMRGDMVEARSLRNQVNRATAKLIFEFYHTRIEAMHESGKKIGGKI